MAAPICASATDTPVRLRIAAATLALDVSSEMSAIRRRFGKAHAAEVRSPGSLNADSCGDHHLYRNGATLAVGHDLRMAHNLAVLGMNRVLKGLDGFVIQVGRVVSCGGECSGLSPTSSTSSGLAWG